MRNYVPRTQDPAQGASVRMGESVAWMPSAFADVVRNGFATNAARVLHGHVIYINTAHRYYTAEAECNGYRLRESFKF